MTIHESDVLIGVNALLPRPNHVQTIPRACKAGGVELEFLLQDDLRAFLLHEILDDVRLVQPLLDIVGLVPPARPHGPLRTRLEQIRLVAQLPVCEFLVPATWRRGECFADQGHGCDEGIVPGTPVLAEIEAVDVADIGPC